MSRRHPFALLGLAVTAVTALAAAAAGVANAADVTTGVTINPSPPSLNLAWTVSGAGCGTFNTANPAQGGVIAAPGLWNAGPVATGVAAAGDGSWTANMPAITTIGFYRVTGVCDIALANPADRLLYRSAFFPVGATPVSASVTVTAGGVIMAGAGCPGGTVEVESRLADGSDNFSGDTDTTVGAADGTWSFNLGQVNVELTQLDASYYARCSNNETLYLTSAVTQGGGTTVPPTTAAPTTATPTTGVTVTTIVGGGGGALPATGSAPTLLPLAALLLTIGASLLALRGRRTV